MQWLAMLTMLIDHIGAVFYTDYQFFRMIGRLSFPIYVYLMVLGYQRTSHLPKYLVRVFLLALLSQIPFQLAFDTDGINVIGTLFISLLVMHLLDLCKKQVVLQIFIVIPFIYLLELFPFDYGAYGLLLMLIYRYAIHRPLLMIGLHGLLEIIFLILKGWFIQFISLSITYCLAFFSPITASLNACRAPNWLWRSFYPLHLIIIYLIVKFL